MTTNTIARVMASGQSMFFMLGHGSRFPSSRSVFVSLRRGYQSPRFSPRRYAASNAPDTPAIHTACAAHQNIIPIV